MGKIIEDENLTGQKDFLKKAGLNLILKGRVLSFSGKRPFCCLR
jgi:hypothetical protein